MCSVFINIYKCVSCVEPSVFQSSISGPFGSVPLFMVIVARDAAAMPLSISTNTSSTVGDRYSFSDRD